MRNSEWLALMFVSLSVVLAHVLSVVLVKNSQVREWRKAYFRLLGRYEDIDKHNAVLVNANRRLQAEKRNEPS